MTHHDHDDDHDRRATDRLPRWLLPVMVLLIVLGSVSVGATIQAAQESQVARSAQVDRIEALIEQLDRVGNRNQLADRLGHSCILDALRDIAADRPIVLPDECQQFVFDRQE